MLENVEVARRIEAMFDADLARSRQVDAARLAQRSFLDRWLDRLAALLLPWL